MSIGLLTVYDASPRSGSKQLPPSEFSERCRIALGHSHTAEARIWNVLELTPEERELAIKALEHFSEHRNELHGEEKQLKRLTQILPQECKLSETRAKVICGWLRYKLYLTG